MTTKCRVSYEPLFKLLKSKRMKINDLRRGRGKYELLHSSVISKINSQEPVSLKQIIEICCFFNVPIEDVVKIERVE